MGEPLVVLVDDVRSFRDGRKCVVARTAADAITVLREHRHRHIDELWLDHDLGSYPDGRVHDVRPVLEELVSAADTATPYDIGVALIHTSSATGAVWIKGRLDTAGIRWRRHHALIWRNDPGPA